MCHGQDHGEASHAAGVGRGSAGQCWAGDGQLLYETGRSIPETEVAVGVAHVPGGRVHGEQYPWNTP
jgi:hypothetical protein